MPSDPEVEGLPGYPMAASATTPTLRNLSDGDDEYPWLRTNPWPNIFHEQNVTQNESMGDQKPWCLDV